MRTKTFVSGLKTLTPINIIDAKTGEIIDWETVLTNSLNPLLNYVYDSTQQLYDQNTQQLLVDCESYPNISPAEYARQKGYKPDLSSLPKTVKAQSRIERLIRFKLISETSSYVANPNPKKKEHTFSRTLNLGAVDNQMASLSIDGSTLTLLWKVWDKELLFEFNIPNFVLSRNIIKWSLPAVSGKGFNFSYQELPNKSEGTKTAGIDYGRKELFTIAITTQGSSFKKLLPSKRLSDISNKREKLLVERKHTLTKLNTYKTLGIESLKLEKQSSYLASKIKRLGVEAAQLGASEITSKLLTHKTKTVHVENLSWAHGNKYGSKWNHSAQQDALTHSLKRQGITVKKVNPKNTSQTCHKCGTTITHNAKTRTVYCSTCKTSMDRDFNAAINILKDLNKTFPVNNMRINGDNYSAIAQVIEVKTHSSSSFTLQTLRN